MPDPHPLVTQLRFARAEFGRGLDGVTDDDGRVRLGPMNSLSWNVGHLAWQEQEYFLLGAQDVTLFPAYRERYAFGAPASTPSISDALDAWRAITAAADPWLDALSADVLLTPAIRDGRPMNRTYGSVLLRVIYHYWYHNGENQAIRQQLAHGELAQFVGELDTEAPYRPE